MENSFFSGENIKSLGSLEEERKMRERVQSLEGMIRKGGEQGEKAKKALLREFGPKALGLVVELQREIKKNKK
ncbi:MAG: hypothetical protein WC348_00130 [Patescibacteria group bacterium]|jgi:hypothetical protein